MAVLGREDFCLAIKYLESHHQEDSIEVLDFEKSYNEFFLQNLCKNRPCILKNYCQGWKAKQLWVSKCLATGISQVDSSYLKQHFGNALVPVADCSKLEFDSHPKEEMNLSSYLSYFEAQNKTRLLYLKDWHFRKAYPSYMGYQVPLYFSSDWLNEFCDASSKDDFRFVYIGPNGTWTPFHADVLRSFSWSANICGKKEWIFYSPGKEIKYSLHDQFPVDIRQVKGYEEDLDKITIIQEEGDIIFVPSNWFHQVTNIGDTISINHNWINGSNIHLVWSHLEKCLVRVKSAISDCSDANNWAEQCQILLKAVEGIDYLEFYRLLQYIAYSRIAIVKEGTSPANKFFYHAIFDLSCIYKVITEVVESKEIILFQINSVEINEYLKLKAILMEVLNKFIHEMECI